jgi:hypothetical protein
VTPTTARLIACWTDPNREKKLFFCQNEALETAIYIAEVAKKYGDAWIGRGSKFRRIVHTSQKAILERLWHFGSGASAPVMSVALRRKSGGD